MFIYHRNVSVSIVAIIRKRNNDELTNNSFFLKYIRTNRQTDTLSLLFIRKEDLHTSAGYISQWIRYYFEVQSVVLSLLTHFTKPSAILCSVSDFICRTCFGLMSFSVVKWSYWVYTNCILIHQWRMQETGETAWQSSARFVHFIRCY
jgi:hypothetical protein